jgi:purine-binding chemotaxis protein CheW
MRRRERDPAAGGGGGAPRAAEDASEVLRRRAAALARREDPERPGDGDPVLAFEAGGERYAIAMGAVLRVDRAPPAARLPGAPGHVVGVVALGGRPIPLVDAPALLGGAPAAQRRWALVLGEGRPTLALAADAVEAARLARGELRPAGAAGPRLAITRDARVVLDPAALLADAGRDAEGPR